MKRQNLRQSILLISFLLFPITQFYFSPYIILSAAAKGIINGSLIVFTILLFGGMFIGRAFCGWFMPCGSLQEICFNVNGKQAKGGKLNLLNYFIWIIWLVAIVGTVVRVGGYKAIDPFYFTKNGISVSGPIMYIIYYGVLLIFISMSFIFGKRATCHYLCWMAPFMVLGRKIGSLLRLPSLHLSSDPVNCVKCNQCNRECPMSLDVMEMVRSQRMDNSECILCGKCIEVCKTKVIKYSFGVSQKKLNYENVQSVRR